MNPYYLAIQTLIQSNTLTMRDIQERIDYGVAGGHLSAGEAAELTSALREAPEVPDLPEASDVAIRLGAVEGKIILINMELGKIKAQLADIVNPERSEDSGEPDAPEDEKPIGPPPGVDEWDPKKSYAYGAQVWHHPTNAIWVSKVGNNKVEPGAADYAWSKIG